MEKRSSSSLALFSTFPPRPVTPQSSTFFGSAPAHDYVHLLQAGARGVSGGGTIRRPALTWTLFLWCCRLQLSVSSKEWETESRRGAYLKVHVVVCREGGISNPVSPLVPLCASRAYRWCIRQGTGRRWRGRRGGRWRSRRRSSGPCTARWGSSRRPSSQRGPWGAVRLESASGGGRGGEGGGPVSWLPSPPASREERAHLGVEVDNGRHAR